MSEQASQEQIEVTVKQLEAAIEVRDAFHRLLANPDFKTVITEGYIEQEALRLTKTLGDASIRANERAFNSAIEELKSIGLLDNHLRMIEQLANLAEADLAAYRSGELDEDED